ncbi:MAG: hypothetical protein D6696_13685 [Acidobacteria bacterium]|nr:MAG: hypothetical protein D6696_13685 [Acidobacteriota bacterium]
MLALPDPEDPEGTFSVRHEAIDDFRGVGGEIWGMDSMAMPFPLADGVSLEGIEVGDKIRFTLEVDHYRDVPMRVTAVEELPADAELDFRPARPPPAAEG